MITRSRRGAPFPFRLLLGGVALLACLTGGAARAESADAIRYMNLDDATVGGRRLSFGDKTVISLFRNHQFTIAGPLHVGNFESGGRKPTKGRWDVRYGNTLYVTLEDGSSRAYVFFKIGNKQYLRDTTGGTPGFGDQILSVSPLR